MGKSEKMLVLHTQYDKKCTCSLKKAATQAVYGNGSANADIVFIGEAPGKKEDLRGVPFIGSSGKLLSEMLASINIKREDVYITNVVKYRPPNNRDPLAEEKSACRDWLHAELQLIKPKLIVFLGRHAMNNFFSEEKIATVHGKILQKKILGIPTEYFLPLYHPAAALYNGSLRTQLFKDFKKIPRELKKLEKFS